ncbi:MAG TPA: type II methionyl aminopeptidase [Candidatus Saccharimonadales bacterium]|nr:type II methionyl aminopeptidase [Candidatus Saccharimonadales bacterium]
MLSAINLKKVWHAVVDVEITEFEVSGRILADVRRFVKGLDIRKKRLLEICELVEAKIRELGAGPAFPCNVGVNEVAAHYTSPWKDPLMIPDNSLVKIDFGVEVNGCITDTAITLSLNPQYDSMIVAAEAALQEAIAAIAPGRKLSEIGTLVERCISRYGFKPIRNLTGHKIERYRIHAGKSVPNVSGIESGRFEVGEIYAVEPFVTLKGAEGAVHEADTAYIYRFVRAKGAKSKESLDLAEYLQRRYRTMPFASRWVFDFGEYEKVAFEELVANRCVVGYPVLVEVSENVVAQAEHTLLVTAEGCRVLTG